MDIDGLGEKQVALLQERGLVTTAADFYRLREEQLLELDGFGEVSVRNLLAAVEDSKRVHSRACCSRSASRRWARSRLATSRSGFRDIDSLLAASPEQTAEIPGIGEKMAASIAAQLADERMRGLIADLREQGLRFREDGAAPSQGPLAGKTLVLTGTHAGVVARRCHRADPRRRRARDGLGVEEDGLPRRRREPRLEAREGRAPGRAA